MRSSRHYEWISPSESTEIPGRATKFASYTRILPFVLARIHLLRSSNLTKISGTLDAIGLLLGCVQRGQQDGNEERDDPNDYEEFNEGKSNIFFSATHLLPLTSPRA